jgi:hypothetical protein
MGLFDRLLGSRSPSVKISGQSSGDKPKKDEETFFLDADASSSLGDVNFMRNPKTIRRTFPGSADSPGNKEMIAEVGSMEARLEKMSPGLAGINPDTDVTVDLTGGVPKPVKKTFAQQMSKAELDQRTRGAAVAVNAPGSAPRKPASSGEQNDEQPKITQQGGKAGDINPFKSMARDLNT